MSIMMKNGGGRKTQEEQRMKYNFKTSTNGVIIWADEYFWENWQSIVRNNPNQFKLKRGGSNTYNHIDIIFLWA